MNKIIGILSVLFIAFNIHAQKVQEKFGAYCSAAEATGRFHGFALVKHNDNVLLSSGYGYSNYETKAKASQQTKYQIGSVTKQFTASIILQLVQENKLKLTDKLSKFFPAFPQADKVTVEHLLIHTSGIFNYTNDRKTFDSLKRTSVTQDQMVKLIASFPYDFEPGSKWSYSNSGYSLLGYIIEKVTGKSYDENVQERIFIPLKMQQSGLGYKNATGEKSTGYYFIQEDTAIVADVLDGSVPFAAGAIYTTPAELLLWDEYLLKQYDEKKEWLANAWTPRKNHCGLGWFIDTIHGHLAIQHGGAIDGYHVQNILFPEDDLIVMVFLNAEMYDSDQIARDLAGIYYQQNVALPETPKEVKVGTEILQQYAGNYLLGPGMKVSVELLNDKLMVAPEGQPPAQIFPSSENTFFFKIMDAKVEFVKDKNGKVEKFLFHQGRRTMEALKQQ